MDDLIKLIVSIAFFVGVVYLFLIILAASAILVMIGLGLLSFYIVKSRRAIVQETEVASAVLLSATWAGALTVGMMVGSLGLLIGLEFALEPQQVAAMQQRNGNPIGFAGFALFLQNWILRDAYFFFIEASLLIYLTNRVFVRRQLEGGHPLLGVLPPMFGFAIFFIAKNWQAFVDLFTGSLSSLATIAEAFKEAVSQPFQIAWWLTTTPSAALAWAGQKLIDSDGSMFRLAKIFPEIFVVLIVVFLVRSVTLSEAGGTGDV